MGYPPGIRGGIAWGIPLENLLGEIPLGIPWGCSSQTSLPDPARPYLLEVVVMYSLTKMPLQKQAQLNPIADPMN